MNKKRQIAILLLALILLALLAMYISDWVRRYLVLPLAERWHQASYMINVFWRSQNQVLIWGTFVMVVFSIAVVTLVQLQKRGSQTEEDVPTPKGPVTLWQERLDSLERGSYFKWRFSRHVSELLLACEAGKHGIPLETARKHLQENKLKLPAQTQAYLQVASQQEFFQYCSTYRRNNPNDPLARMKAVDIVEQLDTYLKPTKNPFKNGDGL